MSLINLFFFILGLIVASATAAETPTFTVLFTTTKGFHSSVPADGNATTTVLSFTTNNMTTSMSFNTSAMNPTYSTIIPSTPSQKGDGNSEVGQKTTEIFLTERPPTDPQRTTATNVKVKPGDKRPTEKPQSSNGDSTGIIILVLIIVVALGLGIACYITKRKGRRYSVDFTSRADEANIPLSPVEPNFPGDSVFVNGLQTFENADTVTKQAQDPEAKPEEEEEQKAVTDTTAVDPSTESAEPAPDPVDSEDKPKEDAVEQSPPPPAEPSEDMKTGDEGTVSNNTSVELLMETNENNSNNAYISQQRDFSFWDIPLDVPV